MYILFALLAAAAFAMSSVLKHRSAQALPGVAGSSVAGSSVAGSSDIEGSDATGSAGIRAIITHSVRHPLWLAGMATDAAGLGLQIVALHLGPLAVVQPLLIVSLVLAFLASRRGRLRLAELTWPITIVLALGVLSALSGAPVPAGVDVVPAAIGLGIVAVVIAACLYLVNHPLPRLPPALVLGAGVGVIYAAAAALLKLLSDRATQGGLVAVLESWQLYALVIAGVAGLVLNQAAFGAGPLHQSLPAISAVDPVASVVVGLVVYDEHLRSGAFGVVGVVLAVAVLAVATVRLSREGCELT